MRSLMRVTGRPGSLLRRPRRGHSWPSGPGGSVTLRNPHPGHGFPAAAGGVEKVDEAWRLGRRGRGRLPDLQAEAGAVELLAHEMQWSLSRGSAGGRGFGESPPPRRTEDEERSCRCPGREAPSWAVCIRSVKTRAGSCASGPGWKTGGSGCQGCSPERCGAGMSPLPPCHMPRPPAWRPWPAALTPGPQSETAGSMGTEMSLSSHTGPGSGRGYTGRRTEPTLASENWALPGAAPRPEEGRGRDSVRSTSRRTRPACPRSTGTAGSSPRV